MNNLTNNKNVLVAMSGGVDSSVAVKCLINKGYNCIGCTMRLYDNETAGVDKNKTCCSLDDVYDARNVATKLGIKHYVFNFTDIFKEQIINPFINSYLIGETPNPCINCNRYLKFDKLFERMEILNCNYIATGHYAKVEYKNGKYLLKKAKDQNKDQTYVLYFMNQYMLSHTLFPLGDLLKNETREIALNNNFINAAKPDSQDICFVPNGNYAEIIKLNTDKTITPGNFIDKSGNILGKHKGIIYYTIGQHKKLGIALGSKYYVTNIDANNNTITLGSKEDLYSDTFYVTNFNFISEEIPKSDFTCNVKIRYNQKGKPALIQMIDNKNIKVIFNEPECAITNGQSAVLYDDDIVLGGGIIKKHL